MNLDLGHDDTHGGSCSTYNARILRLLEGGHGMNEPYVQVGAVDAIVLNLALPLFLSSGAFSKCINLRTFFLPHSLHTLL